MEKKIPLSFRVLIFTFLAIGCEQMGGSFADDRMPHPNSQTQKHFQRLLSLSNDLLDEMDGGNDVKHRLEMYHGEVDTFPTDFATRPTESMDFGGPENKPMSFGQAVVLAREEAKCFDAFGGQNAVKAAAQTVPLGSTNTALAERFSILPFGCFRSETVSKCEQCRKVTARPIPNLTACQHLCDSQDKHCNETCLNLYHSLQNESLLIDAAHPQIDSLTVKISPKLMEKSSDEVENHSGIVLSGNTNVHYTSVNTQNNSFVHFGRSESGNNDSLQNIIDFEQLMSTKRRGGRFIHLPQVFCEGINKVGSRSGMAHFVVLKWNINASLTLKHSANGSVFLKSGFGSSTSDESHQTVPLVFVIEQSSGNLTEWKTIGKTPFCLQAVNVSYLAETYRWRITAVGPNGIEDVAMTDIYVTLDGYKKPGPPKNIYLADIEAKNFSSINALIGWEPPDVNRTCFYKIVLSETTGGRRDPYRIKEPLGVHMKWFEDLKFGTSYDVLMTSRNPSWQDDSAPTTMKFRTPTCLESFNSRFDMCAPPSPRSIKAFMERVGEQSSFDQKQPVLVTLSWLPPPNTSDRNPVEKYIIDIDMNIFTLKNFTSLSKDNFSSTNVPNAFTKEVPGNTTKLVVNNLKLDTEYTVMIRACSIRGNSPTAQYHFSTKLASKADLSGATVANWIYVTVTFVIAAALLLMCNVIRVFVHKRNVKIARNQYFQSMEERDEMGADWSIVPLTEDSSNWKLFDENFPKEKWEISWDDLTMGEVIGQGAFGVVRRAKINTKKLESKLRFRGDEEMWLNSADRNIDDSDPGMETVAVKMVKVSSTRDDREQLIKEITMMQSLGFHPQIVGLLGACTRGRTLCLVLEYCPGGDLLSFVRKVRAKYWPTLGLSQSSPTNSRRNNTRPTGMKFCGNTHSGSGTGRRSSFSSISDNPKSSDSSPINYADIGGFSGSCSSPDENSSPGANENSNCNKDFPGSRNSTKAENSSSLPPFVDSTQPDLDDGEEFRPIDEKDVLSYARQIAMGMEYLEKNRVVHRDLACRNVLLMGDYKHVKISDFGLSRDIYTWNVYHQKSNGKLPIKWMAIESIFTHVFTTKSDVWAFGVLLWELVTLGGSPYPGLGNNELFHLLKSGYRMERPDNCSEELYAVMKKCWRTAAACRPSFTELRRHIETMMEAAEPNLYLSLMADLPVDFFQLGSRSDLHMLGRDDEITTPLRDSPTGTTGLFTSRHNNSFSSNGLGTASSDYGSFKSNGVASASSHHPRRSKAQTFYHNTNFRYPHSSSSGQSGRREGFGVDENGDSENVCSSYQHHEKSKLNGETDRSNRVSSRLASPLSSSSVTSTLQTSFSEKLDGVECIELQPVESCGKTRIRKPPATPPRHCSLNCSPADTPTVNQSTKGIQEKLGQRSSHDSCCQNKEAAISETVASTQSPDSGILIQRPGELGGHCVESAEEHEVSERDENCFGQEEVNHVSPTSNRETCDCECKPPLMPRKSIHLKSDALGNGTHQGFVPGKVKRPKLTLPFVNINDMTIIENRTYDVRDT